MTLKEDSGIFPKEVAPPAIVTVDDMRVEIIKAADMALSLTGDFMAVKHRRVVAAMRNYWQRDDGTELGKLLDLYNQEPS